MDLKNIENVLGISPRLSAPLCTRGSIFVPFSKLAIVVGRKFFYFRDVCFKLETMVILLLMLRGAKGGVRYFDARANSRGEF